MKTRMTIAVLGATGMVGSRVITEGGARGHEMLALSRKPEGDDGRSPNVTPIAVDVDDAPALREALGGSASHGAADAVVVTLRTVPVDEAFLVGATRTVLDIAAELGIRVLVVGGAGALRSPDDPDLLVVQAFVLNENASLAGVVAFTSLARPPIAQNLPFTTAAWK